MTGAFATAVMGTMGHGWDDKMVGGGGTNEGRGVWKVAPGPVIKGGGGWSGLAWVLGQPEIKRNVS